MDGVLTRAKREVDLIGIVQRYGVRLKRAGARSFSGLCPFHTENNASFHVYVDEARYWCYGCEAGGDVSDFVAASRGISLVAAAESLLGGDAGPPPELRRRAVESRRRRRPRVDGELLTAAMDLYIDDLEAGADYLASRGMDLAAAGRLGIGYARGYGLVEGLGERGFSRRRVQASPLILKDGDRAGEERFARMVVVADRGRDGRVRWMQGRGVEGKVFTNLPYPSPLLGIEDLPDDQRWVVFVEGLFDYLTLLRWGFPAVGAFANVRRCVEGSRRFEEVALAMDADEAGCVASLAMRDALVADGRRVRTVELPGGIGDIGDMGLLADGRKIFLSVLEASDAWGPGA